MTLVLRTESGDIDAGFYISFMQFSRIGEYAFPTKNLCKIIKDIADNPDLKQGEILSYNVNKFWKRVQEYKSRLVSLLLETGKYFSEDVENLSLEDEFDFSNESFIIPVEISKDYNSIKIGKYNISSKSFCSMAVYLSKGGFLGWEKGKEPKFSKLTFFAIMNSKNPLFKYLH